MAMGDDLAVLRHDMGIYSLSTLLCTLGEGTSKNINPTTFRLAQSSAVATRECLERSKIREHIHANGLPSSHNFQPGDLLLWFFYAIICKLFSSKMLVKSPVEFSINFLCI